MQDHNLLQYQQGACSIERYEAFKDISNVFNIVDDILVVGYDENGHALCMILK